MARQTRSKAPKEAQEATPEADNKLVEYRDTVMVAAYERLIRCLTGDGRMGPDVDQACQIAHLLKEMGLV